MSKRTALILCGLTAAAGLTLAGCEEKKPADAAKDAGKAAGEAAKGAGEIAAGVLQIHQRFAGQRQYGWNAFDIVSTGLPSVFVTTRRLIAADRGLVQKVVQGMVETIHLFKTQNDVVVSLLQRFLQIEDRKTVEDVHAFYVPLFPAVPRVGLGESGIRSLRDRFARQYPAAATLQESDIVDSSFVEELDKSGFVQRLYANSKP